MARIAVGGFHHETNCFVPTRTDFEYFAAHRDRPPLVRGAAVLEWLGDTSFALSGFLKEMGSGHDYAPLVWTSGGAGGYVTRDAFERIAGEMVGMLSQQMPVDAVYLDLHGAAVSEDFEDAEGELLRRVRAAVGERVPIVISLDYHANVTAQMVQLTDGLLGYQTYPHVDRVQTGRRAAKVMKTVLARGRPAFREIRRWKAREIRHVQHLVAALELRRALDDAFRRLDHRALRVERNEERQPAQRAAPGLPVLENHVHHARGAPPRIYAVDVRIRPVADEPVGELDHLLRYIGVIVEADDDRHVRANASANATQELAFEILEILAHARAMKVEVDGLHRHLHGEHADHLAGDALERIARNHSARAAARPHERHVIVALAHVGEKSR